jgi:hypothetical protein
MPSRHFRSATAALILASAAKASPYRKTKEVESMISVVAFLCALSVSLRDAQATLAGLAIRADAGHRWIVKCARSNRGLGPVG